MSSASTEESLICSADRNTHLTPSQLTSILRWICSCSFLPPRLRYNVTVVTPLTVEEFLETVHLGLSPLVRVKSHTLQIIPLLTRPNHWCLLVIDHLTSANQMMIIYSDPAGAPMELKLERELRGIFPAAVCNDLRQTILPQHTESYDSGICVAEVVRRLLHHITLQLQGFSLSNNSSTFDDPLNVLSEELTHQQLVKCSEMNVKLLSKRRDMYRLALSGSHFKSNAERMVKLQLDIQKPPIILQPVIEAAATEQQAEATQAVVDIEQSQMPDESDDAPVFIEPQPPSRKRARTDIPQQLSLAFLKH